MDDTNDMDLTITEARELPLVPRQPDKLAVAKTATDMRVVEVSEALAPAYAKASTLELTDEEVAALMEPFPDSAVDIRPHDGLIYLSHIHISDRLNKVFRPGKWAMVCRRHWLEGQTMYGEYVLLIRGCFIGESVGGHQYLPNNPKTNYSDVLESTAAEALRRIAGKRLSCGSQVWHRDYADKWVAQNAEQRGGKWYKKSAIADTRPPAVKAMHERLAQPTPKPAEPAKPLTTKERMEKLFDALKGYEPEADQIFRENGLVLPTESFRDIGEITLEKIQPANLLALIREVKMRKKDSDQLPGAEVADQPRQQSMMADVREYDEPLPQDWLHGIIEKVSVKTGKSGNGKPWTLYGVQIGGVWHNTFSDTLGKLAQENKGKEVRYVPFATERGSNLNALEVV